MIEVQQHQRRQDRGQTGQPGQTGPASLPRHMVHDQDPLYVDREPHRNLTLIVLANVLVLVIVMVIVMVIAMMLKVVVVGPTPPATLHPTLQTPPPHLLPQGR